ncbi:hypothetical protein DW725_05855 [Clostridiaceae bacterium AM27-36LB]|nr:hypothetical protein DW644_17420 [Clostridiales bacterium AM23-16LB]RHT84253.1 hypothetical protein DW725_05855 [Clostridiaceae bacterium AM27-36LB]RHW04199.1 hypothetical protein DXA90_06110 [Clostridiaceae bacterium OF09-1]
MGAVTDRWWKPLKVYFHKAENMWLDPLAQPMDEVGPKVLRITAVMVYRRRIGFEKDEFSI